MLQAQHDINIVAELDPSRHIIEVKQQIVYQNTSENILKEIYLLDWANSFSSKTSPLAKRFAYHYQSSFHFEKKEERGLTILHSISNESYQNIPWNREEVDIIRLTPDKPLNPGDKYTFHLVYEVKVPDARFTRFGHFKNGDYNLKHWFISPAVYDKHWKKYNNKALDDYYMPLSNFSIAFKTPAYYTLISDLNEIDKTLQNGFKTTILSGANRTEATFYLQQQPTFEAIFTDDVQVLTSINDKGLYPPLKAIQIDRILQYLKTELGPYPFEKIVVSDEDYRKNPTYGLNQLPNFIRPFPDGFQYDLEQLKTLTGVYLKNTIKTDPREDYWLRESIHIYLMMKYTDRYYPNMKIVGNLSRIWGLRWFHASQLDFNDQYTLLYMNTARLNIDQPISTPKDSLIKINTEIVTGYKGGVGLYYLDNYLGGDVLAESIQEYYQQYLLNPTEPEDFRKIISSKTDRNINWFFDEFVDTNTKIDYSIRKIETGKDSLKITIKNQRDNSMPFSLYGMNNSTVVTSRWVEGFDSTRVVTLPAAGIERVAIDYYQDIPDINRRNNYRNVKGLFNKPLQLRLLQDVEDPEYNQVFFMPVFEYNLYDGITIGSKLYNKTFLPKPFHFKIEPQYGTTSKSIVGGGSLVYTHNRENKNLYLMRFGVSGKYNSYNKGLFYRRLSSYTTFAFRKNDLRNNKREYINLRNIMVQRDQDESITLNEQPNYNVVNAQYVYSNINLINFFKGTFDYEYSSQFHKIYTTLEYRKLFLNNRQMNIRFFAGAFLKNKENPNSDFYSFALDRPTDYLFDYNYYGRSEDSGLFSQQLIIAEGGFKSQLDTPYANQWMTTINTSTNIWKWIYAYGDVGLVKNKNTRPRALFDTGIRLSLVADFFELYFPLYSSNGWEPGFDNYDQRIRFIVTLSPGTLIKLFTRRWY